MLQNNPTSLRAFLVAAGNLSACVDLGPGATATWKELADAVPPADLRGKSILLETPSQFQAARALVQLDGLVRRIVLYPPDLSREHLAVLADTAEIDTLINDDADLQRSIEHEAAQRQPSNGTHLPPDAAIETEWILLTSGTTGIPKLVQHTLASLTGAIALPAPSSAPIVWSTFYDIRRYGGLQIFLRAALTGSSLVLASPTESLTEFLVRAGHRGVTHISGTPSQWRRVLMNAAAAALSPTYVRLSGEIADQAILNQLHAQYPDARIAHAFASTEAGVVLEVTDNAMGIATDAIGTNAAVQTKIQDGTLRVRSARTASAYLGKNAPPLKDADGFVDTGDVLDLRDGRFYFSGRRDGTINVAGLKVHPEEVEAVLNRHPDIGMSLVRSKKSSIAGGLVVADVVLKQTAQGRSEPEASRALQNDILKFCREKLALYKVPVAINFVSALEVAETGKLTRRNA